MLRDLIRQQAIFRALCFVGASAGAFVVYLLVLATSGQALAPEPWISRPAKDWPQIVLSTTARFDGHSPLRKQDACLVDLDGEIVAVTSRYALEGDGSVQPPLELEELRIKLVEWPLWRPDREAERVLATELWGDPEGYGKSFHDGLLLEIDYDDPSQLPATPLKIYSGMPPGEGSTLWFVTSSRTRGQRVHEGWVVSRLMGVLECRLGKRSSLRSTRTRPVEGSPVLDNAGHLVGLVAGEDEGPDGEPGLFSVHSVRLLLKRL